MKKLLSILLFITSILIISTNAFAANGDVAGYIYSTDIVAYIDGMAVPSYNIGGKTVVIAEELANYGFDVIWNNETRRLSLYIMECPTTAPEYTPNKSNKTGQIVGKIYETDIMASVNGMWVESYNIGGRTALVIEDMGTENDEQKRRSRDNNPHRAIGYSPGLMKYVWDAENRTISLHCLRPNAEVAIDYGKVVIEKIHSTSYSIGAYSFCDENENLIRWWVSFIDDGDEIYLRIKDFLAMWDEESKPIFEQLEFTLNDNGMSIFVPDENVFDLVYDNTSTTHSGSNELLMVKGDLNINNEISKTETADMILYNGEIYLGLNALNSAFGREVLSYKYELPEQCTELINYVRHSKVVVYINDNHINSFNTLDGMCYISAKDLIEHGFEVKIDEYNCEIKSPKKSVTLEQAEYPETYCSGTPNTETTLYDIYNGAYDVAVDGKEISDVYIVNRLIFRSPCISAQDLARIGGYKIDTSDPFKVKLYTE